MVYSMTERTTILTYFYYIQDIYAPSDSWTDISGQKGQNENY